MAKRPLRLVSGTKQIRTVEATDLIGAHEHLSELLRVLEIDLPDREPILVEPRK